MFVYRGIREGDGEGTAKHRLYLGSTLSNNKLCVVTHTTWSEVMEQQYKESEFL